LACLADRPDRDTRCEMPLRAALLVSLMHTDGAASDTIGALTTGLDFAEGRIDIRYQLPALWALWQLRTSPGEARRALGGAKRFYDRLTDPADELVGERMMATTHHFLGDQSNARRIIESMLRRFIAPPRRWHPFSWHDDQSEGRIGADRLHAHPPGTVTPG